jgi:crotonobetainyl-CoA:carnitine CoA-transferase CaiB-like acyl-CoA transferase
MKEAPVATAAQMPDAPLAPLAGCRVVEIASTPAAAYAARMLAAMGAQVTMLEPASGSPLRCMPPRLEGGLGESALFAYLSAGKRSVACELASQAGQDVLAHELAGADILIEDVPAAAKAALGLGHEGPHGTLARFPALVHVSVLPFGAQGPKAHWQGEELNLVHAAGEGFLLPNGLSHERFPERAPLKIYGHFAGYQGGTMAALAALSAWWAVPQCGGQHVDVSVQDATLAVGAFAIQRLGDGSLEHRATRRFRYGGVFETRDGFVELLTLEDRQWEGLVEVLDHPAWAADPALADPLERSRRGDEINAHIRTWMAGHDAEEVVRRAQQAGVPLARYRTPADVVAGAHEQARGLFVPTVLPDGREVPVLRAPFQFRTTPLPPLGPVPARPAREPGQQEVQRAEQAGAQAGAREATP